MTIEEFMVEFAETRSAVRWKLRKHTERRAFLRAGDNVISCDCPIEAVARARGIRMDGEDNEVSESAEAFGVPYVLALGVKLGLTLADSRLIVCAADDTHECSIPGTKHHDARSLLLNAVGLLPGDVS